MKLQYFNQPAPDQDDELLRDAIDRKHVPPGCLLGGQLIFPVVAALGDPCQHCSGPRDRCGGRPKMTDEEAAQEADRKRLRTLLTGSEESVIDQLARRR